MHATGNNTVEFEDLLQEARLAFLEHIRKMNEGDHPCACFYDILQAMHRHCAEMAPVRIPINRFNQEIGKYTTLPLDVLENTGSFANFEGDVEFRILANKFLNSLSETDRKIIDSKMRGRRGKCVVRDVGVCSEAYVSRRFALIRQRYYREVKRACEYA